MNFIFTRNYFYIFLNIVIATLTLLGYASPLILYGITIDRIIIYSAKKIKLGN